MGKVHTGADFKFYYKGNVVAYCENFDLKNNKGKVEITSRSSTNEWREYQSTGVKGSTGSASGVVARPGFVPGTETSFDEILNDFYTSNLDVSAMIGPVDVSGYKREFNAIIDDITENYGSLEDKVTYDIAFTVNGPITSTLV